MNKPLIMILFLLQFAHESNGQCENKLDSLGRKQGHWCFSKYEYDYLRDSIPFKYSEGVFDNDVPIGKWYYYKKGSDIIPYSVIEYVKDSGLIDNNTCFISNDSSYLTSIHSEGEYQVECRYDSLINKYVCNKRFNKSYFYLKEVDTFNEAERNIRYRWVKPYYLVINGKRILVTDRVKPSNKYKLP